MEWINDALLTIVNMAVLVSISHCLFCYSYRYRSHIVKKGWAMILKMTPKCDLTFITWGRYLFTQELCTRVKVCNCTDLCFNSYPGQYNHWQTGICSLPCAAKLINISVDYMMIMICNPLLKPYNLWIPKNLSRSCYTKYDCCKELCRRL